MKNKCDIDRLSSSGDNVLSYLSMLKTYYPDRYLSIKNMASFSYHDFVDFVFDNDGVKVIKNSNPSNLVDINHLPNYFFTLLALFSLLNSPHELLPNVIAIDYFDASIPPYVMLEVINSINNLASNKYLILSTFSADTIMKFHQKNVVIAETVDNFVRFYNLLNMRFTHSNTLVLMNGNGIHL